MGKAILVGEHFVVHGAPAIAVPLHGREVRVTLARGAGAWRVPETAAPHLRAMLAHLGLDPDQLEVSLVSSVPIGVGLGSSAALAVALARALGARDVHETREIAHRLETLTHGRASGVDDAVVTLERPVWFAREASGGAVIEPLEATWRPPLVVATIPRRGNTLGAVAHVARWAATHPLRFAALLEEAARGAREARASLEVGAWGRLGGLLGEAHQRLVEVGVSTPELDHLCEAAVRAGALGAKLTGAGLGGAVIALAAEPLDVIDAFMQAGAEEVFAA